MSTTEQPDVDESPTHSGPVMNALYTAWTIIANAHEGDWSKATPEWRAAAERWRDECFHKLLDEAGHPPWLPDDAAIPEARLYAESERFVAGALSTMPPFADFHPQWCLPFARQAIEALAAWEPTDARAPGE